MRHCAFEITESGEAVVSQPQEGLIYFMLRLIHRLQQMGAAPAIDFAEYGKWLRPGQGQLKLDLK